MRKVLETMLANIDSRLSLHDFRIVRGAAQPKLVFDLAVPYAMQKERKLLKQQIDEALQRSNRGYTTVIRFDDTP